MIPVAATAAGCLGGPLLIFAVLLRLERRRTT